MSQQFNNISYKEQELLVLLVEEAAETVVAVAKALRHGFESRHPDHFRDDGQLTEEHEKEWPPQDNRYDIAKEAGMTHAMEDDTPMIDLRTQLQKEYNRCLHFVSNPDESPKLFNVRENQVSNYYKWRAEAIGFCIDKIDGRLRD